jgi:hypothetical protein
MLSFSTGPLSHRPKIEEATGVASEPEPEDSLPVAAMKLPEPGELVVTATAASTFGAVRTVGLVCDTT